MTWHKTTSVNDDSVKAAKIMKKIYTLEDAFDKAVDCYISQHGGMFGRGTRRTAVTNDDRLT